MFHIPGRKTQVRLFDRVETEDPQYDIYDVGLQYADGGIDSLAVGGSFHSLKRAIAKANANIMSPGYVPDITPAAPVAVAQPVAAVVDRSGDLVDVEGL
jgi:hypothetical protein